MPCKRRGVPRKSIGPKAVRKVLPEVAARKETEDAEDEVSVSEPKSQPETTDKVSSSSKESSSKKSTPKYSPKKSKVAKKEKVAVKKPTKIELPKPKHPTTSQMIIEAVKSLKDRNGSSLQAIKKYMTTEYSVDTKRSAHFIKKYLKAAVESGDLIQTKGVGATGCFKWNKESGKSQDSDEKPKKTVKQSMSKQKTSASKSSSSKDKKSADKLKASKPKEAKAKSSKKK